MKLRALEVTNWRCINALRLTDLPDGIVVLHGPNGIGKSSLVQALRSCLFDHDHHSQDRIIKEAVPWTSKAVPRVVVTFEHAGACYRLTKVYSKNREGLASLEEQSVSAWTTLERGKEVGIRLQALLGVSDSEAGLYQLLWPHQGQMDLPAKAKVDPELRKAIEDVLGNLITGLDVDFKIKLDNACERWFTAKTMAEKKGSPLSQLAQELADAQEEKEASDRKFRDVEDKLSQLSAAQERHPELQRDLDKAHEEKRQAENALNALSTRRHLHELATKEQKQTRDQVARAQKQVNDFLDVQARLAKDAAALATLQGQLQAAVEQLDLAQKKADQAAQEQKAARQLHQSHQESQKELDQRQQLLHHTEQLQALTTKLADQQRLANLLQELEQHLAGPAAPTEKEQKDLQDNRAEAQRLQARLAAEAIRLSFRAAQTTPLSAAVDDLPPEQHSAGPDADQTWTIRQHAVLTIPGVGVWTVARATEKQDLDQAVRDLAQLEETYRTRLLAMQGDPDDPRALDHLTERRVRRAHWDKERAQALKDLAQVAPQGAAALHAQQESLTNARLAILDLHPDWLTWEPSHTNLDSLRQSFQRKSNTLSDAVKTAETAATQAQDALTKAKDTHAHLDRDLTGRRVALDILQQQLAGLGAETELRRGLLDTQSALLAADAQVQATALTDQEQQAETRLQAADHAYAERHKRHLDNDRLLHQLRGALLGTEGLHQARIQAEQKVNDLTERLERERRHAQAHKHLRDLFDGIRQQQVQRTVGPVSTRVLQWARHIGVNNYRDLDFGDHVLPGKLLRQDAAMEEDGVDFATESYGRQELLCLLVRLALGGLLAKQDAALALLDDPLAHVDPDKHRRFLEVLRWAAAGNPAATPPAGPLQVLILTCHPDRFDYLPGAQHINLEERMG